MPEEPTVQIVDKLRTDLSQRRELRERQPARRRAHLSDDTKAALTRIRERRAAQVRRVQEAQERIGKRRQDLSGIDQLAREYLDVLRGDQGIVLSPTTRLHPHSEGLPIDGQTQVRLGTRPEDVYWHTWFDFQGDNDYLRDAALIGFFAPWVGLFAGPIMAGDGNRGGQSHQWWFEDLRNGNAALSDGTYRATALVLAWGEYSVHAGGFLEKAEVRIEGFFSNADSNYRQVVFARGGDDITETNTFVGTAEIGGLYHVSAGALPPIPIVEVSLTALANGNGTHGILNLLDGVGGAAVFGCSLEKVA